MGPQVVPPPALAPSVGPVAMTGRLFLTGVAEDITQDDLRAYFGQFGPLEDVYVQPGGKHIAFVSFPDQFTALAVLQIPDHEVKPGRVVHVEAAYERPPLDGKGKGSARYQPYPVPVDHGYV